MKKAIVKKVVKSINNDGSARKDNYGNYSFIIDFDNGDGGFYNSKSEDQTKFVVGKEAEYNIEEKVGTSGKKYNKITLPQFESSFSGGGFKSKPAQDPKIQMISFAMAYTKDLIVAGKVQLPDMEKEFKRMYTVMTSML